MKLGMKRGRHLYLIQGGHERNGLAEGIDFIRTPMATPQVLLHPEQITRRKFTIQVSG
jgi:hypothetical protein